MWDTSEYWKRRAGSAIAHAKYKERPAVRARRIKGLEAERRKLVAEYTPHEPRQEIMQEPNRAPLCAECGRNRYAVGGAAECVGHDFAWPGHRAPTLHVWAGSKGSGRWVEVASLPAIEGGNARWIAHLDRRLEYELEMLAAEGQTGLLEPKARPKHPPILNYRVAEGETLDSENLYNRGEIIRHEQRAMTKTEWKKATQYGGGGVRLSADKTHRFRTTSAHRCPGYKAPAGLDSTARTNAAHRSVAVFLTDSKAHARPEVAS